MKKGRKVLIMRCIFSVLIALGSVCGSVYAQDSEPAGHAIFVHDTVWRIPAEMTKVLLQKGDAVYETDTIITSANGSAQLVMSDGAFIAVRPKTSLRLDVYRYDKEDDSVSKSIITLLKGCFRSITGMIGKQNKENYRIKTAVANIGIRGTDHEPLYIPEPEAGEAFIGEPGLYDKVYSGETYIENEAGIVTVLPNQTGYVPDQYTEATVDETMPDVYEQYNTTVSEDAVESVEPADSDAGQVTDSSVSGDALAVVSSPTTIQEQVNTQQVVTDVSEMKADAVPRYAGTFTWSDTDNYKGIMGFGAEASALKKDSSGIFTGYHLPAVDLPNPDWIQTVGLVNPNAATTEQSGHYADTTITFGTWQADALERTRYGGDTETFSTGNGLLHWIKGDLTDRDYLSQVVTGTQTYTFDGGTAPTNQAGIAGTLNSATLSVDFSSQAVDTTLQLSVNSHEWSASATDIPIDRGHFEISSPSPSFIVQRGDGLASLSTSGHLSGSFAGSGLTGAMLGYTFGDTAIGETVNGTASFFASGQDTGTLYREIGIAGVDSRAPMPATLALHAAAGTVGITHDGSGNITGFDTQLPAYTITPSGDAQSPVHLDIGAASMIDTGSDTDAGISWGRWSGSITATDRVSDTAISPSFDPQALHFIAGPEMSSPVTLPIMGSQTYQYAGGTHPTDNAGNIGTLNSATLSADFTNMTVATGINATVGTTTFDAASSATPIDNGRYFNATHLDSLTIACTGDGAGTTHSGIIAGSFYGEQGGSAGVAYSFNTIDGVEVNTTISGTAAFKK